MISITVDNYRRIEHAEIECAPIALLSAVNDSGKTSIAEAVAAALTGDALPDRLELKKSDVGKVVHDGAKMAVCTLKIDGGEARISWPECKLHTTGPQPPHASLPAIGDRQSSIPEMSPKDRAAALLKYLKAEPTKEDLTQAMAEMFVAEAIEKLWAEIEARGWDTTQAAYETARRDAQRDWEGITGERFGSDKAANWTPTGVPENTTEWLQAKIVEAKAELEQAVSSAAVDQNKLDELRILASDLDARKYAVAQRAKALKDAREEAQAAVYERQALPAATSREQSTPCPCCGEALVARNDLTGKLVLEKYEQPDDRVLKRRRDEIATAEGKIARTRDLVLTLEGQVKEAEALVSSSEAASQAIVASEGKTATAPGAIEAARKNLSDAENALKLRRQFEDASKAFRRWKSADLKIGHLRPDGLRKKKLAEAVGIFNSAVLAPLCEVSRWPLVIINEDLSITVGDRPYRLRGEGVEWRARIIFQIAQAMLDGSSMIIVDYLPDLDSPARGGLFRLLQHAKLPALVCSAEIKGMPVPDLAALGIGKTYLIKDARATPLS